MDSKLKILGKKIPESFKRQNLNLPSTRNSSHSIYKYSYSIYIILGIINNLPRDDLKLHWKGLGMGYDILNEVCAMIGHRGPAV